MDPSLLAGAVIGALTPLLAKGGEEVAKSIFKDAYTAIKDRLSKKPRTKELVDKFEQDPARGGAELQPALAEHLAADADLAGLLNDVLEKQRALQQQAMVNQVDAENVIIAQQIQTLNIHSHGRKS